MKISFLLSAILFWQFTLAQNLTGSWSGELTQDGKTDTFFYQLDLRQTGENVSGEAISKSADGKPAAKFEVAGIWNGKTLALQEVRQTQPPGAKWCLKHLRLQLVRHDDATHLEGNWTAEGCTPGKISLVSEAGFQIPNPSPAQSPITNHQSPITNHQSPITGRWSGQLSQDDRGYGFYFEINLAADGTGASQIISDGEGGNATHRLRWAFDAAAGELILDESEVAEKSVPTWRWCLKTARLKFEKDPVRLSLQGEWQGFIEGFSQASGACAPGKIYLEKPLPPVVLSESGKPLPAAQTPHFQVYQMNQGRKVEVGRVLEVKSKTVRIAVWDSGTVDGDVCSLFLNGDIILKDYRVTRQKNETIVKLEKPVNYLILHALDLGSISPNTVAVSVNDGVTEQVVIVSSNLKESGAVMIREFSVK